MKAFGRQHEVEERFRTTNDELYEASFGAQFMSSLMQPATMFLGNLQYVHRGRGRRAAGGQRRHHRRRRAGVHPVLPQVLDAAHPAGLDDERLPVAASPRWSGCSSCSTPRSRRPTRPPRPDARRCAGGWSSTTCRSPTTPTARSSRACRWWPSRARPSPSSGPTGAGKTTLVNLIMRFYELDGGLITLDGVRHRRRSPAPSCARNIGMVLQDTWLFGGTIRDNIAYGNPDGHRGADPRGGQGHLRRPLRALTCPTATTR